MSTRSSWIPNNKKHTTACGLFTVNVYALVFLKMCFTGEPKLITRGRRYEEELACATSAASKGKEKK